MKSTGGILNAQLSRVIAELGHTDGLVVTDAGLPIPREVERVDLALRPGLPRFLDVLDAVLGEVAVEGVLVSSEITTVSPELYAEITSRFPQLTVDDIPHVEFKARTRQARAAVRSGEFTPFANVLLTAGVVY